MACATSTPSAPTSCGDRGAGGLTAGLAARHLMLWLQHNQLLSPGLQPAALRWRDLWVTATPIWLVLASSRLLFYGLERIRHPDIVPPVSADAIVGVLLWPVAVVGSYWILKVGRVTGWTRTVAAAIGSAVLFGVMARPLHATFSALLFDHPGAQRWLAAARTLSPSPRFWEAWLATTIEYGVLYLSTVFAAIGFLSFRSLMQERLLRAWAEAAANRERLRALRSQLNPHFLFNVLNTVMGAAPTHPEAAQEIVKRLSEVLRQTLLASEEEEHELRDELHLIEAYMRIEQIRRPSRIRWRQSIDPDCLHAMVPSLLLLPLVENAVKHGLRGDVPNVRIKLLVTRSAGHLLVKIVNTCPPVPAPGFSSGLGLRNTRERLAMLFGSNAKLVTVRSRPSQFAVELTLPWRTRGTVHERGEMCVS